MRAIKTAIMVPVLALLLAATGCETPAPEPVFPDLTFAHLTPIGIDVSTIKVIENYCQTRAPQVSCRGSFLQPDGQIRTVDPRGELVMEASGVSVEASALPDSCPPVAD